MKGPPLGPGREDITWPDQVAPRGRKASSTRDLKPQPSNLLQKVNQPLSALLLLQLEAMVRIVVGLATVLTCIVLVLCIANLLRVHNKPFLSLSCTS